MNAQELAKVLLDKGAVKLSSTNEFVWASGIHSPVYCDNRLLLSFPDVRKKIAETFAETIQNNFPQTDVIAGVATGAVAWGALAAHILNKSYVYVRPGKKSYGLGNQIEGRFESNARITVVEDLVSTGGSSLKAVQALRDASAKVTAMLALFTYNLPLAGENFQKAACTLNPLSDFDVLVDEAVRMTVLSSADAKKMISWRNARK